MTLQPTSQQPSQRHILIVEDDVKIADMLANYLLMDGFATEVCGNGHDAVTRVRQQAPALIVLDLMLPGLDGVAVCAAVRAFSTVPIMMVTARVDEIDRLLGLDTGADDYVCKPFSPREVVARIKALLRRSEGALAKPVPAAFAVDEARQQIHWRGQPLPLTPVEFRLMRQLMSRPGQVFARARLLDTVHEDLRDVSDRAIDSHIKNMRRKLEQAGTGEAGISSVYGVGYRFDDA
ncbi:MAG: response regulator [Burkholderiales bacterium]|nr:response regulator [Burkholderiales bacterium]